jgi:hypothetical protein
VYIQQIGICHVFKLTGCWQNWNGNGFLSCSVPILPAASQHKQYRIFLFYVFNFMFNSVHVSSTSCSSSGETNCVNTTSDSCHSVLVAVYCAGRMFLSDLHTIRPPTESDSYQRLY